MFMWPPLTGTQLSPVAPRSWARPGGHTPGNRHDRQTKPTIYEANQIAAAKAKRAARNSQAPWINTANAQALPTCPRYQRTFRVRISLVRHLLTQYNNKPIKATSVTPASDPTTKTSPPTDNNFINAHRPLSLTTTFLLHLLRQPRRRTPLAPLSQIQ
ncbi:unnamed protein product [Schistocephalus solidus]|uniref:Uncharacterized protein n=1 Tax=Schistocephalus solidus TaxID=70667 RepID=A0A183TDE8_SCHSO|nr:unnamed protein product [Schistocephalus solidus]